MLVYALVQALFIRDTALFETAFCFIYLLPILLLPHDTSSMILLPIAFLLGVFIDLFYNTVGFNASALLLMVFLRPYWISLLAPSGGYDIGSGMSIAKLGLQWFASYSLPLIFIFSLALFMVQAGGFTQFHRTLLLAVSSTLLTFVVIVLSQYIFHSNRR